MRINVIIFLSFIALVSCKTDPNKEIDQGHVEEETYYNKEIGWTMKIPKGWNVTKKHVLKERVEKGLDAINETAGIDYDMSGLKQLINFQKGNFHIFQSTSEPFELEYEGEWEENNEGIKDLIYEMYTNKGIKIDTSSSYEKIDDLDFRVFHITVFGPDGKVMLYQDMYNRHVNGYDFGVNINYISEKEKNEMMDAWKNSQFE